MHTSVFVASTVTTQPQREAVLKHTLTFTAKVKNLIAVKHVEYHLELREPSASMFASKVMSLD